MYDMIKRWDVLIHVKDVIYGTDIETARLRKEKNEMSCWRPILVTSLLLKYRKSIIYIFHVTLPNKELQNNWNIYIINLLPEHL